MRVPSSLHTITWMDASTSKLSGARSQEHVEQVWYDRAFLGSMTSGIRSRTERKQANKTALPVPANGVVPMGHFLISGGSFRGRVVQYVMLSILALMPQNGNIFFIHGEGLDLLCEHLHRQHWIALS